MTCFSHLPLLLTLALGLLFATPGIAQYQVRFIETGPLASTRIAPNRDYFSVLINGVYLNQQESFFRKNNIAIKADLTVNAQQIPINVYADRDPNTGGRLGIFNRGLLYMVPCTGRPFELGLSIIRRDKNDPMKRTLDFLSASENDSLLKTFATSAVPYMGLIGRTAGMLYDSAGPSSEGDKLFLLNAVTFMPHDDDETAARDRYALRDVLVVICRTDREIGELSLDDQGNIRERQADGATVPLRGCPWMAVRVQKFAARSDYGGREWSGKFREAMRTAVRDAEQAEALFKEGSILLAADRDFTENDRLAIEQKTRKALDTARRMVAEGKSAQVELAMKESWVAAQPLGKGITAGSDVITLSPGLSWTSIAGGGGDGAFTIKSWPINLTPPATEFVFSPDRFLAYME